MALKEILAVFGIDFDVAPLAKGEKKVDTVTEKLGKLGKVVAGAAVVVGLKNLVGELQATAEGSAKSARDLRMSTQQLQELEFAAGKSRVEMSDLTSALETLREKARLSTRAGIYNQTDGFKRLGIAVRDSKGKLRSTADMLPDIADKISGIKGEYRQAAFATRFFGDAGKKILPLLKKGSAGIKEAREEIAALGGGMSDRAIEELKELTDAEQRFGVASMGLKVQIASVFLPILTHLINKVAYGTGKFIGFIKPIVDIIRHSSALQTVLLGLGGAGLMKVLSLVGGFKGLLTVLRAASLTMMKLLLPLFIIDEIITTFRGGDTLIRRAIDGMFGEGTTKKITDWFVNAFTKTKEFVVTVLGAFARGKAGIRDLLGDGFWFGLITKIWDFYAAFINFFSGGWVEAIEKMSAAGDLFGAIIQGTFAELRDFILGVAASMMDSFGGTWNSIVEGAQWAIGFIKELLDFIPGVSALADKVAGLVGGAKLKDVGQYADAVEQGKLEGRVARANQFDAINHRLQTGQVAVSNPVTVNVTVPAGTPAGVAHGIGQRTGGVIKKQGSATRAAVAQRAG